MRSFSDVGRSCVPLVVPRRRVGFVQPRWARGRGSLISAETMAEGEREEGGGLGGWRGLIGVVLGAWG